MPDRSFTMRRASAVSWSLIVGTSLTCSIVLFDGSPAGSSALSPPSWTSYRERASDVSLAFPRSIFVVDAGRAALGVGHQYRTSDGHATLMVFRLARAPGTSPADFLRRDIGLKGLKFSYKRVTPRFFVVSAVSRGKTFYGRCNFNPKTRKEMKCVYMEYPAEETRAWDKIVTRISLSLEH